MEYMTDNDIDVCCLQETFLKMDDKVKIREIEESMVSRYTQSPDQDMEVVLQ